MRRGEFGEYRQSAEVELFLYKSIERMAVRKNAKPSKVDGRHGYPSRVLTSYERRGHRASRRALSMRSEHSNKNPPRLPRCPSCAQIMRYVRTTSRFEELPDLYIFECRGCGVTHIEAA
jgi:hypothetical protein